jgi:Amt family ammonium transporter
MSGAILTGVLASAAWGGADGLLSGNARQLLVQVAGIVVVALYSGLASWMLLKLIALFAPLRTETRAEGLGLDLIEHGEEAYTAGEGAILVLRESGARSSTVAALEAPASTAGGGA